MSLISIGIGMLALGLHLVALVVILYGAGNSIYSIVRGTVPLALFGREPLRADDRPPGMAKPHGTGTCAAA